MSKIKIETINEYELYINKKIEALRKNTRLDDDIISIIKNTGLEGFYDGIRFSRSELYVEVKDV